jgi:hypothetical protein
MNSVFEIRNFAHETLVNDNFSKAIFINTKVKKAIGTVKKTTSLTSIIYKNIDEITENICSYNIKELKIFDSTISFEKSDVKYENVKYI